MKNNRKHIELAKKIGVGEIVQKDLSDTFFNPGDTAGQGINGVTKPICERGFNQTTVDCDTYDKQYSDEMPETDTQFRQSPLGNNYPFSRKTNSTGME